MVGSAPDHVLPRVARKPSLRVLFCVLSLTENIKHTLIIDSLPFWGLMGVPEGITTRANSRRTKQTDQPWKRSLKLWLPVGDAVTAADWTLDGGFWCQTKPATSGRTSERVGQKENTVPLAGKTELFTSCCRDLSSALFNKCSAVCKMENQL